VTIGDVISTDLGQVARNAAIKIAVENIGGEDDAGTLMLADTAAIIKAKLQGRPPENQAISSRDLVNALVAKDDRPWKEWKRGRPLTEDSLARLLKPFNLRPKRIRAGANLIRGYVYFKVLEAAERYVDEEAEEVDEEAEEDGSM
jgi:hypothetical protein